MGNRLLCMAMAATAIVGFVTAWVWRTMSIKKKYEEAAAEVRQRLVNLPPPAPYIQQLAASLPPGRVVLPQDDPEAFLAAMAIHFSVQNRTIEPACVIKPGSIEELSLAVRLIAKEHAARAGTPSISEGLFAIRCTGANPAQGVAGIKNGVLLDLSRFDSVEVSKDKTQVVAGGGCTWSDIYKTLDAQGLAVVGGRATPVGIGGSVLGGGISFYSGHYGFMCSNVVAYTVVLADGTVATASATERQDLWRALKGGLNNFGVVAAFTLRCFPGGDIWAGAVLTLPCFQRSCLQAYYDHGMQESNPEYFDPNAPPAIMTFAYMPRLGISFILSLLRYTLLSPDHASLDTPLQTTKRLVHAWPAYWKSSPLYSRWSYRSHVASSHQQAAENLGDLSVRNQRQRYVVTGFKLDLATLQASYDIYLDARRAFKNIGLGWTTALALNYQTLNPRWFNKGDQNVLGLEGCEDPLVVMELTINWDDARHDDIIQNTLNGIIDKVDQVSRRLGTWHRFVFTNYANESQKPLEGYGEDNVRFLKEVSRKYDPDGLFQTGCPGGFKLGREDL